MYVETKRALLQSIREYMRSTTWDDSRAFDPLKAAACAALAQLTYLEVPEFEFEKRGRFKLMPSETYRHAMRDDLAAFRQVTSFEELVQSSEFARQFFVLRSANLVVIGVRPYQDQKVLFLAVRGTSSLYKSSEISDWKVNLRCRQAAVGGRVKLHRGFLHVAMQDIGKISAAVDQLIGRDDDVQIYLTGHSLGGAVSAILYNLFTRSFRNSPLLNVRSKKSEFPLRCAVNSCYTFGMPRYGNVAAVMYGAIPYHVLHEKDVVPQVPPMWLGYSNSRYTRYVESSNDPAKCKNRISAIKYYHDIEHYRNSIQRLIDPAVSGSSDGAVNKDGHDENDHVEVGLSSAEATENGPLATPPRISQDDEWLTIAGIRISKRRKPRD